MVVKRGQVWIVNFEPGFGTEIRKKRPAIVISVDEVNNYHFRVIVIPISARLGYFGPATVSVPADTTQLKQNSVALVAEIRAVDKQRLVKKIGNLSESKLKEVDEALKLILGMIELE